MASEGSWGLSQESWDQVGSRGVNNRESASLTAAAHRRSLQRLLDVPEPLALVADGRARLIELPLERVQLPLHRRLTQAAPLVAAPRHRRREVATPAPEPVR